MKDWHPDLTRSSSPRYMAIADMIEMDLRSGVLAAGDRLPPQRELAKRLNVDFTTVARGYVEAQKRGLVDSHVGRGTFVIGAQGRTFALEASRDPRPVCSESRNAWIMGTKLSSVMSSAAGIRKPHPVRLRRRRVSSHGPLRGVKSGGGLLRLRRRPLSAVTIA